MRGVVDPDESQFYQAIIWIAAKRPKKLEELQSQNIWTGARWFYATLDALPKNTGCSTALIVIDSLSRDELVRVPDLLLGLESHGTMVASIIVFDVAAGTTLHQAWRDQLFGMTGLFHQKVMPLIIAVDLYKEAGALLLLLNRFTYAAMLVCMDWFDVRVAASGWQGPCRYRKISSETFDGVLTAFNERLGSITSLPLLLAVENDFNMGHFSALADILDECRDADESTLATILTVETDEKLVVEINWLEMLSI